MLKANRLAIAKNAGSAAAEKILRLQVGGGREAASAILFAKPLLQINAA